VSIPGSSLGIGYWSCWASVACVMVGTVAVLSSTRGEVVTTGGVASEGQIN
jgi:hypothetical protein